MTRPLLPRTRSARVRIALPASPEGDRAEGSERCEGSPPRQHPGTGVASGSAVCRTRRQGRIGHSYSWCAIDGTHRAGPAKPTDASDPRNAGNGVSLERRRLSLLKTVAQQRSSDAHGPRYSRGASDREQPALRPELAIGEANQGYERVRLHRGDGNSALPPNFLGHCRRT